MALGISSGWIQLVISVFTTVALPLWGRSHPRTSELSEEKAPKSIGLIGLAHTPGVVVAWSIFIASCGIEYICGVWGSTFLVESKNMPVAQAAEVITFYYIGMTLGRFLSGVLAVKLSSWKLIHIGTSVVCIAILLLVLPLPPIAAGIALFLIGLGNGPIFPNMLHLTPQNFGEDISQSVMGSQMAAAYTGIMVLPLFFGFLAQGIGTGIFPYYLLILLAFMVGGVILMTKKMIKRKSVA